MPGKWITPPAYAESRGIGLRKVLTFIESGELKAVNMAAGRTGRPRWKISPEAIEAFEAARTTQGKAAAPATQRRRKPTGSDGIIEFY